MFYSALIEDQEDVLTFENIYHSYKNRMYHIAVKILKDSHLAEDALQEAFLGIARNMKSVPKHSEKELRAYIFTVIRHASLNILQKQPRNEVHLDTKHFSHADDEEVFNRIINEQNYQDLLQVMMTLPLVYREILMMRYVLEMQPQEIAAAMDRKVSTVYQQITRGKRLLLDAYKKEVMAND